MLSTRRAIPPLLLVLAIGGCGTAAPPAASVAPTPATSTRPIASLGPSANQSVNPSVAAPSPTPEPLPQGSDPRELDPADFVATIDHPYWPMAPGSRWFYRETDAEGNEQKVEVTVTGDTKMILGIQATVVHDVVSTDGQIVEDTLDWYAQDRSGNLWYLGEDTKEFEGGKVVSTEGSWEAGVDGALAGIILPGEPRVGLAYRQEYYEGEAEDAAEILSLDERAEVPFGKFGDVLMTRDTTALEPDVVEHKFYAKGIGPVLALGISGGASREELVLFEPGSG